MKTNKKLKSIHDRAICLLDGGVVWVDGNSVRAVKAPTGEPPCDVCEMDCLCHKNDYSDMPYLCTEVDEISRDSYYLKLVNPN